MHIVLYCIVLYCIAFVRYCIVMGLNASYMLEINNSPCWFTIAQLKALS